MADELKGWLRRLRPPTSADAENWADTDEGLQSLSDIHRRVARVHAQRRARVWTLLPAATVASAAAAILVATAVSTPDSTKTHANPPILTNLRPAAQLLTPFASCDALLSDLRKHALAHVDRFQAGGGYAYDEAMGGMGGPLRAGLDPSLRYSTTTDAKAVPAAAQNASGSTSTTNVQEVGVDEPDVVKTDGDWVLTVTDGWLRVLSGEQRKQIGALDLRAYNGWQTAQLLASGNKAVVLLTSFNYGTIYAPGLRLGAGSKPVPDSAGPTDGRLTSTLLYVDLFGTPRVTGSMTVDGSILDARMVGSTARVVASTSPQLPRINTKTVPSTPSGYKKAVQSEIKSLPLKSWLPTVTITGPGGTRTSSVPCASVSHPEDYSAASMLTVYTVDPTKPDADPQPVSLTADGSTVYATTSSLYVASNPTCAWCGVQAGGTTEIHRFDISGTNKPVYLGSGTVNGSLLSQYSLSDYNGYLRVATTTYEKNTTVSGVDVLNAATLKQTGSVGGLGKGERVYAVRFLGALGYVVTYRQQDPLYVIDLSEPSAPKQVGALEIPGFSSYLHDVGGGRLLGVGQDTSLVDEGGSQFAHNEGRMVQLFDVSNPSKPTRTAKVVLPGTGTPGDPSFDPHAFLYWQQTGLVVVPVANYGNGGALAVRLDGKDLVKVGTVKNPGSEVTGAIERTMIVDGELWTFSPSGVKVSAQADLDELAWISFG